MTTTANPLLENCCAPCNNNCPDDWEITEAHTLPANDCGGGCCGQCSDKWGCNIVSTNECLDVDTTECGVVKLTAICPPIVVAWENVTVDVEDCDLENCSKKYIVNAECEDEKVKACSWDTTPGYLNQKIIWDGKFIDVDSVGCDWHSNSKIKISFNEDMLPDCEHPPIIVNNSSNLITTSVWWPDEHTIWISDKTSSFYRNAVCLWFLHDQDFSGIDLDDNGNTLEPSWVKEWEVYTWNKELATAQGIRIKEPWYYRIFGQLTVRNNWNVTADRFFLNLWRWLLRIKWDRPLLDKFTLSTAKHWAYGRQILLSWGNGINIWQDGIISFAGWYVNVTIPEWGGSQTATVVPNQWWWAQTSQWFDGPWMTFNVDAYVDLRAGDLITLWYRGQSDMAASEWETCSFKFVWVTDSSTEFSSLFGGSVIWVHMLAPVLFQNDASWQVFDYISNI